MVKFGDYITPFHWDHFIYIIALLILALALFRYREVIFKHRYLAANIILVVAICQQIMLYGSYLFLMRFNLSESLPFQINRISSILVIVYLFTKNEQVLSVVSYFGAYAWFSFLYPIRVYGVLHPIGISFFVGHALTLLLPYFGILAFNTSYYKNGRNFEFLYLIGYTLLCVIINPLVDGNYFYLKNKTLVGEMEDFPYIIIVLLLSYGGFWVMEKYYLRVSQYFININNTHPWVEPKR